MGLNREDKATVIAEISEVVSNSSAMVIAEYRGLTVQAVTKLRAEARKNGVTVRVVKNTLVRRAVEGTGFAGLADQFTGPLVYGFSADPVAVASMPSREELLAKLMATMNEPIAKFVRTLNEVPARFVRTVAAVRDAKEQAAA